MNPSQQHFFSFIAERASEGHKDAAEALLKSAFEKQSKGTFTREDLLKAQELLIGMIKPEAVGEVKVAMAHFVSQMK